MRKITNKETQQIILNMLIDFDEYCEQNELVYFLVGGTLLGAIRHKGFIPWDDDIDVGMPRKDYEKFIQLQRKSNTMEVRCVENENSDFPFMKIVNENTYIKKTYASDSETSCLWIDVFPFDGWSDDEEKSKKDLKKIKKWFWLLVYAQAKIGVGTKKVRIVLKTPLILLCRLIGGKRIAKQMNKISQKYNCRESSWIGNFSWAKYGIKERVPSKWFEDRVKLSFEGHEFWGPKEYDKYLTNIYGEYMKLPPEEQRETHNMEVWLK